MEGDAVGDGRRVEVMVDLKVGLVRAEDKVIKNEVKIQEGGETGEKEEEIEGIWE